MLKQKVRAAALISVKAAAALRAIIVETDFGPELRRSKDASTFIILGLDPRILAVPNGSGFPIYPAKK